uniref:Uncharacterized protein n=1 Tax=Kalanchoe fedtschenkoi TaxID=63787 RepID=A0A7N0V8T5_KALFE
MFLRLFFTSSCILDGEMLVLEYYFDTYLIASIFTYLYIPLSTAKAAREGLDSERQIYVLLSTSVHGPKTYLTVKVLLSFGSCAVSFGQLGCKNYQ